MSLHLTRLYDQTDGVHEDLGAVERDQNIVGALHVLARYHLNCLALTYTVAPFLVIWCPLPNTCIRLYGFSAPARLSSLT